MTEIILEKLVLTLKSLPKELIIVIVAALPIFELRLSIPLGFMFLGRSAMGKIFLLSLIGNFLPVIPALMLLTPLVQRLHSLPVAGRFFRWFFERTKRNASLIEKYESVGLALFVAVPLPLTGAWSGAIAASIFKIRFRYAVPAIAAGIFLAGLIVTLLCLSGSIALEAMGGIQ